MPSEALTFPVAPERRAPTRGDRRRRAILDAVEELVRERTIGELAVEEIARTAGLSRPAFYFYFDSKYSALAAALGGVWEEMARGAAPFFEGSSEPPAEYVPRALADVAAAWRAHEHLLVAMVDACAADNGARELWDAWIGRFAKQVAARVADERAAGRALPGPPRPADLAAVLLAMNERAYYNLSRRGSKPADVRRTVEALSGVWLAAIWGHGLEGKEGR